MTTTRLVTPDDAAVLAHIAHADRDFLAPWEPARPADRATEEVQREEVRSVLEEHRLGLRLPHVVLDDAGEVVGRITLSSIVRGAFPSCSVGYWIRSAANGRGHATAAVRAMVRVVFGDLGLHRVEAGTLRHDTASLRVLERTGFERYGLAPEYLRIAGRWQDHVLFPLLDRSVSESRPRAPGRARAPDERIVRGPSCVS